MMCLMDMTNLNPLMIRMDTWPGNSHCCDCAYATKSCRDKDVVMRLGGDEFALFIPVLRIVSA